MASQRIRHAWYVYPFCFTINRRRRTGGFILRRTTFVGRRATIRGREKGEAVCVAQGEGVRERDESRIAPMAYWIARVAESYLRTDFEESCGSLLPISMRVMRNFIIIHINNESTVCLWSNSCISSSSRIYIEIFPAKFEEEALEGPSP